MKYSFQKKSFWIILAGSFLIIFLFPPVIGVKYKPGYGILDSSDWESLFSIGPRQTIRSTILIFEIVLAFLLNYLGHLIFSKPGTK
jgi:hypothetical protein